MPGGSSKRSDVEDMELLGRTNKGAGDAARLTVQPYALGAKAQPCLTHSF